MKFREQTFYSLSFAFWIGFFAFGVIGAGQDGSDGIPQFLDHARVIREFSLILKQPDKRFSKKVVIFEDPGDKNSPNEPVNLGKMIIKNRYKELLNEGPQTIAEFEMQDSKGLTIFDLLGFGKKVEPITAEITYTLPSVPHKFDKILYNKYCGLKKKALKEAWEKYNKKQVKVSDIR